MLSRSDLLFGRSSTLERWAALEVRDQRGERATGRPCGYALSKPPSSALSRRKPFLPPFLVGAWVREPPRSIFSTPWSIPKPPSVDSFFLSNQGVRPAARRRAFFNVVVCRLLFVPALPRRRRFTDPLPHPASTYLHRQPLLLRARRPPPTPRAPCPSHPKAAQSQTDPVGTSATPRGICVCVVCRLDICKIAPHTTTIPTTIIIRTTAPPTPSQIINTPALHEC